MAVYSLTGTPALHFRLNQHTRSGHSFAMTPSLIPSETSWGKSNEPVAVTIFTGLGTSSATRPYSDWSKQTSSDPVYRPTSYLTVECAGRLLGKRPAAEPPTRKRGNQLTSGINDPGIGITKMQDVRLYASGILKMGGLE